MLQEVLISLLCLANVVSQGRNNTSFSSFSENVLFCPMQFGKCNPCLKCCVKNI